jgi:hypothetical protein
MSPTKWARVRQTEAHGLRRGAWYAVVNGADTNMVLLDVNKSNRPVSRGNLEFSEEKPDKWSVVKRGSDERAAKRASNKGMGPSYGVCPSCRERILLAPSDQSATCPSCNSKYEVDWANPC